MSGPITGAAGTRDVEVRVHPGGALADLRVEESALRQGGQALAATLLDLVARATAEADARAANALGPQVAAAAGLGADPDLAEAVEATTPDSWRAR
ncbi:hypothetical protein ACOBQX_24815 [Actinokineospora sp. G85]|uniref:hypothetical protein n=1 Tax=Actinokineospora sp. G85 TaxID=3406626 RepID=UPI003C78F79B